MRRLLLAAALAAASPAAAQDLPPDQAALKAHVQFLAADALHGREASSADFAIASEYAAAQMLATGLKPAGTNGSWFQPVTLATYRAAEKATWSLAYKNVATPLQFGIDFFNQGVPGAPSFAATAPVVFAGYGIVYAQGKRDDYAGLDVRGKIVALLPGVPPGLPNAVEAHFGSDYQKALLAEKRGARAVVMLESAAMHEAYPFAAVAPFWNAEQTTWAAPDGRMAVPSAGAPIVGLISSRGAEKLFAGSRIRWADVLAAEAKGKRLPTGPLAATLSLATRTSVTTSTSRNVIGVLPGSDPKLRDEYVVLSAHLDHVGIGDAVKGDRIYNGAVDNALGVAAILEVARAFQASGKPPRRSILFVALTAEEKGLLGSDLFAHHPTVPGKLVADINLDMPILTFPLQDLVVLGGERSSLGPLYDAAAATEGLKIVPDPAPEEMFFVRSDHYSFVQAGVPSVSVDSGPGGAGEAAQRKFLDEHYHKPSDDLSLPIDWPSAAKFTRVNYAAARAIADADARPRWNKGDFFGVTFNGYGAW